MFTADMMREMWPHGDARVPGLIDGIVAAAPAVFTKYGLSTDLLVAHAMAQFSHECGAGTEVVENLNYSPAGLMRTWPNRFGAAKAAVFAHDQRKIADEVYDGRMGNRAGTDDGWNFRGRGGSQVTGRAAYETLGHRIGHDLLGRPDLVNDPALFLECAVADFVLCGCLPFAAQDDVAGVTYHLNGGFNGLSQREVWLRRWKTVLHAENPMPHGTVWVQQALNRLGTAPPLLADGTFGPITAAAVKSFQQTHGLTPDGRITSSTIAAIEQSLRTV